MPVLSAAAVLGGAAHGAITFDDDVTPDAIFGSGNLNGSFTVDRQNGVELGLRGKLRYPPSNIFNSNGDGTYTFNTGSGTSSPPNSEWSFEWSVNTDYDDTTGLLVGDLTYEIGMDTDPGPGTSYLVFDPISIGTIIPYTAPAGPVPFWDHSMGDNATANGAGVEAGDAGTYATYLATYNVAQNSWRPTFYQNTAPYAWDPDTSGRYEYYLAAFDGASEVARTAITIIVVDGPSLTLEADACQGDVDAAAGVQIAVTLHMRNAGTSVTGFQAFLEFDPLELAYRGDLSAYNDDPFDSHVTGIADADDGLPAGELRLDGADFDFVGTEDDTLLATLVFDVLVADCESPEVDFDLDQAPFDSELSADGVPIVTALVNSGPMTVDDTAPTITCPDDIVVNADAGGCTAVLDFIETFDSAVVTSPTQAPGVWYTDRYAPAVFETAMFDGDMRLRHGVDVADSEANRPPSFSSPFYNTQGRKYDIDMPVGTTLGADLYIPASWETGDDRRAGMWATTFDPTDTISGFPIIGFTSIDDIPRFRFFTQDTDQDPSNGFTPDWVDLYTLVPADFGRWYRFETKLTATAYEAKVIDVLTDTVVTSYTDVLTFESVRFGNIILQVYNFGDTYDVHWDNVTLGPTGPVALDNCSGPMSVTYVRGDDETLTLSDPFPSGTTTVTWTATDCAGNSDSCDQLVTVNSFNDVAVDLELDGSGAATRCLHLELDGCIEFDDVEVTFDGSGLFSGVIEIPCGDYDTICIKDEQHTLWASSSLTISGASYVADSAMTLLSGDTDNDSDVDINDITWLLFTFGDLAADGDCPYDGTRDADFNNDGAVGSPDYSVMTANWLAFTSCAGCLSPPAANPPKLPETSILSAHLDAQVAARVDMNGDGRVDALDVGIFEAIHGLPNTLSNAMREIERERSSRSRR